MLDRHDETIRTTLGDLIEAWYEAALDEVGDEETARHIASVLVSDLLDKSEQIH
jgi:hypothetical protein